MILDDSDTHPTYGEVVLRKRVLLDDVQQIVELSSLETADLAKKIGVHPLAVEGIKAVVVEKHTALASAIVAPEPNVDHVSTLDEHLANARMRVLAGEDFQQVVNELAVESLKDLKLVVAHPIGPVHDAADASLEKLRNAVAFAFSRGRASIDKPALKDAVSTAQALVATAAAADVVKQTLGDVLPKLFRNIFDDGGEAGVEIFLNKLRLNEGFRAAAPKIIFRFDKKTERAAKWAEEHAAELVTNVSKTTREAIKHAVVNAFEKGTIRSAYKDILDAVGDEDRAELIARTESMRAANAGQREAWEQAVENGFLPKRSRRVWIYTPDESACALCEALDGEVTTLNGEYPGDGGDGPPLHPRCRCTEGIIS